MEANKVERATRDVIERKILTALTDDACVAILATKQYLEDLHAALCGYVIGERRGNVLSWSEHEQRCKHLARGIRQLKTEAFGD